MLPRISLKLLAEIHPTTQKNIIEKIPKSQNKTLGVTSYLDVPHTVHWPCCQRKTTGFENSHKPTNDPDTCQHTPA